MTIAELIDKLRECSPDATAVDSDELEIIEVIPSIHGEIVRLWSEPK
jgi:hypothetical protein